MMLDSVLINDLLISTQCLHLINLFPKTQRSPIFNNYICEEIQLLKPNMMEPNNLRYSYARNAILNTNSIVTRAQELIKHTKYIKAG